MSEKKFDKFLSLFQAPDSNSSHQDAYGDTSDYDRGASERRDLRGYYDSGSEWQDRDYRDSSRYSGEGETHSYANGSGGFYTERPATRAESARSYDAGPGSRPDPVNDRYRGDSGVLGGSSYAPSAPIAEPVAKEPSYIDLTIDSWAQASLVVEDAISGHVVRISMPTLERSDCIRVLDFLDGMRRALRGSLRKLGPRRFLFVPADVDLTPEMLRRFEQE